MMGINDDLGFRTSEHDCEEFMIECTVCGAEFCSRCFPNSHVCSDCRENALLDDEDEDDDPDFDDVPSLKELMSEDEDAERLIGEDEEEAFADEEPREA